MHNSSLKGKSALITQQSDILPSVLDFMHYDETFTAFGKSIFDTCTPHFAVSFVNNTFQLVKDGYVFQFGNDKPIALFDLNYDMHLKKDMLTSEPEKARELETFLKAYIQTFNNRMIKNKLTDTL
jgi:hypothetical protein